MEKNPQIVHWRAVYENGQAVEQLENSEDILYDNIDKEKLLEFWLLGYTVNLGVNLKIGSIKINGSEVLFSGFSNQKTNYKLIYYVVEKKLLGSSRSVGKVWHLGLQATIGKSNKKVVMALSENGVFIDWSGL